ncbi:hypothetical protein [Armatimonas sp.]|uniref:hypothetical protein n=1 Tax=Armatimonas sp. TaxID=1872638 RepID=UPI00286A945B|nr:hypothetical protein [Armatimonas sp.]
MKKTAYFGTLVTLMALPLVGCGAAKSIINNNIPAVANLLKLDEQTLVAIMGEGRAVISGNKSVTVSFPNQSISQASSLASLAFYQSLSPQIIVTVPSGATMPADFPLSNLTLQLTIREGAGSPTQVVNLSATVAGPVTFTRTSPTSNVYAATEPVVFTNNATGTSLQQVLAIVTGGADPNAVDAKLSVDSDDTKLPSGSTLTFSLYNGSAKPKL